MKKHTKTGIALVGTTCVIIAGVAFGRAVQDSRQGPEQGITVTSAPVTEIESDHRFDKLSRVTNVARDNGHSIDYDHDPSGNITATASVGRSSGVMQGEIIDKGNLAGKFTFEGEAGEPVTLRLEAIPREAGVGKFAELKINGKTVISALPVELTRVLPRSGKFVVRVKKANQGQGGYWGQKQKNPYLGPYNLTLEATAGAVGSFVFQPEPDSETSTFLTYDELDGRRGR